MEDALPGWKWEPVVRALMSLRGVQVLTAMTLVAEVGDFSRFEDPRSLMHFFGLTPSEHTSGDKRVQGGITKCGNAHCRRVLVEAAWQYRLKPKVSAAMQKRQEKQPKPCALIAWKAQQRLHKRFKHLAVAQKERGGRHRCGARTGRLCLGHCPPGQTAPAKPAAPEIIRTCRGKVYQLEPGKEISEKQPIAFKKRSGCTAPEHNTRQPSSRDPTAGAPALAAPPLRSPGATPGKERKKQPRELSFGVD